MNRRDATTALIGLGTAGPLIARTDRDPALLDSRFDYSGDSERQRLRHQTLLDASGRQVGDEVRHFDISSGLDRVFAELLEWRAQAIAVAGSAAVFAAREQIASFALRNRLPTACASSTLVDAGCLLSYNAAGGFVAAIASSVPYIDRIFRGTRPANLAVSRPEKYDLVINLKTAKALGLQIPQSVLLRTDRVIQ